MAAVWAGAGFAADARLSPADQQVIQALQKPIRLDFDKTPLQDVVAFVRDARGIDVRLDEQALRETGIKSDTPVTRNVKEFTLQAALRLILGQHGLTHVVSHGTLVITTEAAGERLLWRGAFDPTALKSPQAAEAAKKIAIQLKAPVKQGFVETPLEQIVQWLRDQFDIPIQIDERGLARAQVAPEVPCVIDFQGITLESALGKLTSSKGLRCVVEDEYVLITGPQKDRPPVRRRPATAQPK